MLINITKGIALRIQGDHAQYYRTALRYLGCIDLDSLTDEAKMQHAFFLGLAALLGILCKYILYLINCC